VAFMTIYNYFYKSTYLKINLECSLKENINPFFIITMSRISYHNIMSLLCQRILTMAKLSLWRRFSNHLWKYCR